MNKEILVIYEDWQYDCCGEHFKIGDFVEWSATSYDDTEYHYELKDNNKNIKYDFTYEGCAGGFGTLKGKVKCIKSLDNILEVISEKHYKQLGYKIREEYKSSEELKEKTNSSNMLVILEDVEYKLESPIYIARLHNTILVHDVCKDLGLTVSKVLKNTGYNIILSSDNKKELDKIEDEVNKFGKFTKTEKIYDLFKNKDKYLHSNFSKFYKFSARIHIVDNDTEYNEIKDYIELSRIEETYQTFYIIRKRDNDTLIEYNDILPTKEDDVIIKEEFYIIDTIEDELIANTLIDFLNGKYKRL